MAAEQSFVVFFIVLMVLLVLYRLHLFGVRIFFWSRFLNMTDREAVVFVVCAALLIVMASNLYHAAISQPKIY